MINEGLMTPTSLIGVFFQRTRMLLIEIWQADNFSKESRGMCPEQV